jgi:hypothetical protein
MSFLEHNGTYLFFCFNSSPVMLGSKWILFLIVDVDAADALITSCSSTFSKVQFCLVCFIHQLTVLFSIFCIASTISWTPFPITLLNGDNGVKVVATSTGCGRIFIKPFNWSICRALLFGCGHKNW